MLELHPLLTTRVGGRPTETFRSSTGARRVRAENNHGAGAVALALVVSCACVVPAGGYVIPLRLEARPELSPRPSENSRGPQGVRSSVAGYGGAVAPASRPEQRSIPNVPVGVASAQGSSSHPLRMNRNCKNEADCVKECLEDGKCRQQRDEDLKRRCGVGGTTWAARQESSRCVQAARAADRELLDQAKAQDIAEKQATERESKERHSALLAEMELYRARRSAQAKKDYAEAKPDPSIARGRAAGVSMTFFDVPLGAPIRTIPDCRKSAKNGTVCQIDPRSGVAAFVELVGLKAPPGGVAMGPKGFNAPKWVGGVGYGIVNHGVIAGYSLATDRAFKSQALKYLKKKYGPPTRREGTAIEWLLPGLHVVYSDPSFSASDMADIRSVPPDNCDRRCDPAANPTCIPCAVDLPTAVGALMINQSQLHAANQPNLVVQLESVYRRDLELRSVRDEIKKARINNDFQRMVDLYSSFDNDLQEEEVADFWTAKCLLGSAGGSDGCIAVRKKLTR